MNLKITLRRLSRFRLNSFVIVLSLSIGLACINLIGLFIFRELKTDSFHQSSNQIFSLTTNNPFDPGQKEYFCRNGSAEYITQNISQVEDYCRYRYSPCNRIIVNNEQYDNQTNIIKASPNFFEFFSYELQTNNPKTALETSNDIVISNELAFKYFGAASAVGQIIQIMDGRKSEDFVVRGIFRKPIQNSQLNFDMVRKIGDEEDSPCFIQLASSISPKEVEPLINKDIVAIPTLHDKSETTFHLVSLSESYFDTVQRSKVENNRDRKDIYIAFVIGLLILIIALINYLGLVDNDLQEKQKEYAIRLINGSSKRNLLDEFGTENNIYLGLSLVLSFGMMCLGLPFLNALINTQIQPVFLFQPTQLFLIAGLFIILVLVAFAFAYFKIRSQIDAKTSLTNKTIKSKNSSFSPFNVLQIAATITLIVSSTVVIKQMNFITEKPIGINKEVIEIKIPWARKSQVFAFRDELKKNSNVELASIVNTSPVLDHYLIKLKYFENDQEKTYTPAGFEGDEDYMETLGIHVLEGQSFSQSQRFKNTCLINETLADLFPNKHLIGNNLPGSDMIVIGIVENFHYKSLKNYIEPAFVRYSSEGSYLLAKPTKGHLSEAMTYTSRIWKELIPDYPVNIESVHDRYAWLHRENKNFVKLIFYCCLICIFLSMSGLFAIAVDNSLKRTKEIGIRKVNGARISEILIMLNHDFVKWVAIAFVIATPIAYYAMNRWLQNFAYKTELSWWIFALAGLLALGIALLTVSWQSWRAARRNPVEALRYE